MQLWELWRIRWIQGYSYHRWRGWQSKYRRSSRETRGRRTPWCHHTWPCSSPHLSGSKHTVVVRRPLPARHDITGRKWLQCYLETGEQCLRESVKCAAFGLRFIKVELSSEQLHAEQGEDDEEEEKKEQQRGDGLHGVQQRCHQVGQSRPMPEQTESDLSDDSWRAVWPASGGSGVFSHRVTLKIRSRRTQRSTEIPRGGMISSSTRMVSTMPPHTTKQSKRLKNATK